MQRLDADTCAGGVGPGIEVEIPLVGYFQATPQPDAGIEPDVPVVDSVADIASVADRAMATAMQMLR